MSTMKMQDVERESLKDLKILVQKSREWKLDMAVIGGYAVRAFTNAYRHTKDIDIGIAREEKGNFIALFKELRYKLRDTSFGLAASKKFDSDFIDIHISVGKIFDMSSGLSYPITKELFDESKVLRVGTRYSANKKFETDVPIINLNTLYILKSMPKGRPEKDSIDIVSLILDQKDAMKFCDIVTKCENAKLIDHILEQLKNLAQGINNGDMTKIWNTVTGVKFTGVQKIITQKFLRELDKKLRGR